MNDQYSRHARRFLDGAPPEIAQPTNLRPAPRFEPKSTLADRVRSEIRLDRSCDYIVKGLLLKQTLVVLFGSSGAGKTFVALDLALKVARGEKWFGLRVKPRRVIYIAAEGGGKFDFRIAAALEGQDAQLPTRFRFLPEPVLLDTPSALDELCLAIERHGPFDVVFLDTLARSMTGDENIAKDMNALIRNADHLRTTYGAAVVIVHHAGKDESRGARGSSALRAAVDTEIEISRDKETDAIRFTVTKQRDLATLSRHLRLETVDLGEDEEGDPVSSFHVVEEDAPAGRAPVSALSGQAHEVWEALIAFADAEGAPNPGGAGWPEPGAVRTVDLNEFRSFAAERLTTDAEPDSKRKAVSRAVAKLREQGRAQINRDRIWAIIPRTSGLSERPTAAKRSHHPDAPADISNDLNSRAGQTGQPSDGQPSRRTDNGVP